MANGLYEAWKTGLMTAAANTSLNSNTVQDGPYASLMDTAGGGLNQAHDFYNDVSAQVVGVATRIQTPTVVAGVFDGADVVFTAVSGATVEALVIHRQNAGGAATWYLVAFIDGVTGLPVTPNGGDINVTWHASGIFKL